MSTRKSTTFYCFSPPVMLATMGIETALLIYTLWRYRLTVIGRLAVAMLVSLAVFQLAEYFVCTGYGFRAEQWSRLGFVAITALPPLGLHMVHALADKPKRLAVRASYLSMVGFMTFFLTYHAAFIGYKCTGNYVIFQIGYPATIAYSIYYYGWLAAGIGLGMRWANQLLEAGNQAKKRLQSVRGLIVGYLIFIIPTALANSVKPETRAGIPSILCGFAVLFAVILVLYIMPRAGTIKQLAKADS
jgi:hypothetical protein